jgi:serine phosphatase RsbU (regulator of sigma subunit)
MLTAYAKIPSFRSFADSPLKNWPIILLFISVSFGAFSGPKSQAEAEAQQEILQKKVDFILKVANNVSQESDSKTDEFIIAVYGRNGDAKDLYNSLKTRLSGKSINNKPAVVKLFRRMMFVKEADLIYVNGDTKISLNELEEKVGREFVLVTEDFPYGQSMINFVVDEENGLSYAIQEEALTTQGVTIGSGLKTSKQRVVGKNLWAKRLALAQTKIKEQKLTIVNQEGEIDEQSKTIKEKVNTIEDQESTISEKKRKLAEKARIINYQRTIIIGGIIVTLIILGLIIFLVRLNQKKKAALSESETKTKEILASINYAERIQRASLPSNALLEKCLNDGFIFFQPKDIVSGDFYWLEEKEGVTYFAVADCTGHGVPGAMLSVLCSNSLSRAINEMGITEPAKILDETVTLLEGFFAKSDNNVQDGMDIALCRLEKNGKELQYAGANRPLYFFQNGVFNEIKADRQPIGSYAYRKKFTNHVLKLEQGDCIYLFSDGIVDQFGGERSKKFSSRRLKELLGSIHNKSMEEQKTILQQEFESWQGDNESIDDVCLLGVRFV